MRRYFLLISLLILIEFISSPVLSEDKVLTSDEFLNQIKEKLSLDSAKDIDGKYVQKLKNNIDVTYTIIPEFQNNLKAYLNGFKLPYSTFVAIEPKTGRVLAIVDCSSFSSKTSSVAFNSIFPAASIFKIISSAAFLEYGKVSPEKIVCYHGGSSILFEHNIIDNKRLDKRCRSFSSAFAHSTNSVIGKLAVNNIDAKTLLKMAEKFGFNKQIYFLWNVEKSVMKLPKEKLSLARTAAGFTNTTLSPLHGALIGSLIANGGIWIEPQVVEKITTDQKEYVFNSHTEGNPILSPETINELKKMMILTTIDGTARKHFYYRPLSLQGIDVAIKTGSLTMPQNSELHTSWMVGFAPANNPEIAFASLVVNQKSKWKIKAGHLTRKALDLFFSLKLKDKKRS